MPPLRLALIGFGNVGQGFVEILQTKKDWLAKNYGFEASIVAVSTLRKGSLYRPDGLDLEKLVASAADLHNYPDQPGLNRDLDTMTIVSQTNADTLIEASYTNLKTGEPAISYVKTAFESGKHVILANKGPVALAFHELATLAASKGLYFGYEATVMGGTPALRLARTGLAGCTISGVRGILNGTTNYILSRMEIGATYADALAEAQQLGYAEADPSGDVEGLDAAGKLAIIVGIILGTPMPIADIQITGIVGVTTEDITKAHDAGERWKLIAQATLTDNGVTATVQPEHLSFNDPLAGVGGGNNAITYQTDLLGPVTLIGPGAGRRETGFAILSDLLEQQRRA